MRCRVLGGVAATARDARASLVAFVLSGVGTFFDAWLVTGQELGDLPSYVRGAFEISAAYGGSMGQLYPRATWGSGIAFLGTLGVAAVVWLRSCELETPDRTCCGRSLR